MHIPCCATYADLNVVMCHELSRKPCGTYDPELGNNPVKALDALDTL